MSTWPCVYSVVTGPTTSPKTTMSPCQPLVIGASFSGFTTPVGGQVSQLIGALPGSDLTVVRISASGSSRGPRLATAALDDPAAIAARYRAGGLLVAETLLRVSFTGVRSGSTAPSVGHSRQWQSTSASPSTSRTSEAVGLRPARPPILRQLVGLQGLLRRHQYTDPETGLQYLRARYYDPATAQFLGRDPLSATTGSPYAYAHENPLNGSDPSGLVPCRNGIGTPQDNTCDSGSAATLVDGGCV